MTGYVETAGGTVAELPPLIRWQLSYTTGTPCDSFTCSCPWDGGGDDGPVQWSRFTAKEGGDVVFRGVVDECEVRVDGNGSTLEVTGRGLAALLLDNEALGQDYVTATLEDILRDHVLPYGIEVASRAALPAVGRFSVAGGSSEWSVLEEFCRYHGAAVPRFDRMGRLELAPWRDGEKRVVGDRVPVTALRCTQRRYGVLSEIWVRDRVRQTVEKIDDPAFRAAGGQCRRVMTMPGRSDHQTMRYTGRYQLERSAARRLELEVELPLGFFAWPGELVELQRSGWGRNGIYRVAQAQVEQDGNGIRTRLELVSRESML